MTENPFRPMIRRTGGDLTKARNLMKLDSIAQRLKYARKIKGLTQVELAALAGTTQDVIQKIENGKSKRPRNIEKLAEVLEVSPAWLQFGDEQIDKLDKEALELALKLAELTPEQRKLIESTIDALKKTSSEDPS